MLAQFLRFGLVGVGNTLTCLLVIWTLTDGLGVPVWQASALGYALATLQSYALNRLWTFGGGTAPVGPQLLRFVAVNVVMGIVYSALTTALTPAAGVRIASVVALLPVVPLSFLAMRRLVFGAAR